MVLQKRSDSIRSASRSLWEKLKQRHGFDPLPTRYIIILVSALATTLQYTMRVNLSVTIVAMVNNTASLQNPAEELNVGCPVEDTFSETNSSHTHFSSSTTSTMAGSFDWSPSVQGFVLGAFYYGYIVTHVFAGQLADWMGARWLVAMSILTSSVLTLLTPIAADFNVIAVIVLRVVTGMAQGVMSPAMYTMFANWIPEQERSTALALIVVGGNMGTVLTMPLSGYLCQHGFAGGWPSVFYTLGICGCVCFGLWFYFVYDTPTEHPRILGSELIFIHKNLSVSSQADKKALFVPWGQILTSPQTLGVAVSKFCGSWGQLMLMSKLPAYLESILHFPIEKNGFINSLVYVTMSISLMGFGYLSDFIGRKGLISREVSRKLFEAFALLLPALCLALIPVVGCDQTYVIFLLVSSMFFFGAIAGGDSPIVVDIAPDFSGSLYGVTNAVASVPGFLAPLFVGLVLDQDEGSIKMWNFVFLTSSGIYVFGALVFILVVKSETAPWGRRGPGQVKDAESGLEKRREAGAVEGDEGRRGKEGDSNGTNGFIQRENSVCIVI